MTRRSFIGNSVKVIGACALVSQASDSVWAAPPSQETLRLAFLSDTHVAADPKFENRKFFPAENLKVAVSQTIAARPQAVFHTGDVARVTGEVEDYQAVKNLLGPLSEQCPTYVGLGNHDNRENFLKVFTPASEARQKVTERLVLVVEYPALRVILLDSILYVNRVAGLLGKAQRTWLDQYLASCDTRPTVLLVHHTLGDQDGELLDVEALYRIVQPYRKVKAIIYGHSHEYAFGEHHGIHLVNLPAVGYNFGDKAPVGWVDARFSPEGVELTLRAFGGNRDSDGKTTSLAWRSS